MLPVEVAALLFTQSIALLHPNDMKSSKSLLGPNNIDFSVAFPVLYYSALYGEHRIGLV